MKVRGKIGSNGVYGSDNVEKRFEPDIQVYIHTYCKARLTLAVIKSCSFDITEPYVACNNIS